MNWRDSNEWTGWAELATSPETSYAAGALSAMEIESAGIDTAGFKPHQVCHAGVRGQG